MSSSKSVRQDTISNTSAISSTFSGDTVNLNAGRDLTLRGSNVVGAGDVTLAAGNNLNIEAAEETHQETHYYKEKKTGFSSSGSSVSYGNSQLTTTHNSQQVTHVGSTIGSVAGDISLIAGNTYTQTGSSVVAPQGDIDIIGSEVNIQSATDTTASQQTSKYKSSGISIGISSSAVNLAESVGNTAQQTVKADSNRNKVLNALQTYANGSALLEQGAKAVDVIKAGDAKGAADAAGVKISISIGSSSAKSSSSTEITTHQQSLLKAGGNVTVKTTENNINLVGSQVLADKNITLDAAKNINLAASADTEANRSNSKSSSASIGVSFGVGNNTGFSVDLAASRGKGSANSDSTTYNNTRVVAGNTLTLESAKDINLTGANAEGRQIIAKADGDLNIESLQDTATSKAKQSNTGISVSVPIGTGTGSASISQSSQGSQGSKSNYASVFEQSGLQAGEGGFDITVKGNTDLKGAVIKSDAPANKNQLTTGTLTTADIQNRMDAKASSSGMTLSTDMLTSKYAAVKGVAGNLMNHGEADIRDSSITLTAVAPATVTITDEAKQQQLTGKTATETVASLNRDTTNTNRVLAKPDVQALQQEAQQRQADNMLLVNTVTAFTDESFRKMFVDQTKMYKKIVDADGKVQWVELASEEKRNLKPGLDGKVHIFNNGIFNPLENAQNLATQNNNADYLVYFPEANNFFSELLVAGYQK